MPLILNRENERLLHSLLDETYDLTYFIDNYWTCESKAFFSICQFRKDKIERNDTSYEHFFEMWEHDKLKALHCLLQLPITEHEVQLLQFMIAHHELTLEEFYNKHRNSPMSSFLQLIG